MAKGKKQHQAALSEKATAMKAALKHYEQIFSKSRDFISLLDKNYRYLAVNKAYSRFHQKKAEDIIGKTVAELLGAEFFRTTVKKYLDRCLAGENTYYQAWFDFADIGKRFMEVNYFPIANTRGAVTGIAVFIHDLTEIKQLESELKQHAKELREVNKALETALDQSTRALVEQENRMYDNLQQLVFPYLLKLEQKLEGREELLHINVIQANLEKITSAFTMTVSSRLEGLTPRELQVAQLIKQGRLTKDIALLLHISSRTVEFYRDNLRKKLGVKNRRINLRSYLSSLT